MSWVRVCLRAIAAGAVAMAFVALGTVPSQAQSRGIQTEFGELSYRLFCSGCHGPDGRGNGDLAQALGMPLGDLTQIAKRNGGVFPAEEIRRLLTGRGPRGHSDLNMAPWAQTFAEEFENFASRIVANAMVRRRIDHLVAYLESIQEK